MPDDAGKPGPQAAFVSLGSNMGDSPALLARAREALDGLPGLRVAACSSVYRTEPQGLPDQPFFLNQVLRLDCGAATGPEALLLCLLELETRLGRRRGNEARFGPRPMDLDLLLFGNQRMKTERLTLPHPRMLERAFVLVPLLEIAPDLTLPHGITVKEALQRIAFTRVRDTILQNGPAGANPGQIFVS